MAKLMKPDASMTNIDPQSEKGFLPSEIVALLGGDELQAISSRQNRRRNRSEFPQRNVHRNPGKVSVE